MSLKVYHLRVRKVESISSDQTSNIGNRVIKLTGEDSFKKFIAHLPVSGYVKSEPPKIEKVLSRDPSGGCKELGAPEIKAAQEHVDKILKESVPGYKKEVPDKKYDALKKQNEDLLSRLEALEGKGNANDGNPDEKLKQRKALEVKAKELDIQFDGRLGDKKLLEKINAIDPEFKI